MRIELDLQLALLASSLYRLLAVPAGSGLETAKPRTLFNKLVGSSARVEDYSDKIIVMLARRA